MTKRLLLLIGAAVPSTSPVSAEVLTSAVAQHSAPAPAEVSRRADEVVGLLQGRVDPAALFSADFLAQVPVAQVRSISEGLVAAHGAAQRVERVEALGAMRATIVVRTERALIRMAMGLEAAAPHRIATLLVTGTEPIGGENPETLLADLRGLPGQISFAVARLGDGAPAMVAEHRPDEPLAIGSTFKLIILAELSRQVQAGRHRWSEVAELDRHSLPSGLLQDWPLGAPLTLHTLASLMISRSDNTATDLLLRIAGRENVEAMMARMGMASAARNRPFLSTIEAFQLKGDDAAVRAQWARLDEAGRRRLLRERYEQGKAPVDLSGLYQSGPVAIDTVEWFASAKDLVKAMDWLRQKADATAHSILAINPGLGRETAGRYGYLGFKGGSEPGVINLTFLIRNNEGVWHVVTGSWNNPSAAVDENRFLGLMTRAVGLVR